MPHQDLVILFPICACMALVTLVLSIIETWILYSTPGPHFNQGPLVPFWASTKLVTLVPPLGLILTW